MTRFATAAFAVLIAAALHTPVFAQGSSTSGSITAPTAPVAPTAPTAPVANGMPAHHIIHDNGLGGGGECTASLKQLQADVTSLRAEVAELHQMLAGMQAQQKPVPHSVADVPGR